MNSDLFKSNPITKFYHWLHGKWPAGTVEKLPVVGEDGKTNVAGVRVVGDLSGVPLLKFSSETGAKAVHAFLAEADFQGARGKGEAEYDLAIIGGGVSGISAAMEAQKAGLSYILLEAAKPFSTIANFPIGKPIFTYPTEMTPSGGIQYSDRSSVRESLLEDMQQQASESGVEVTNAYVEQVERKGGLILVHQKGGEPIKALRCVVAIGRSGNYRKLGVPGEELDKVSNRLHDPKDFCGGDIMIVGGGDSAAEAAIALAECGSKVTLSYRKPDLTRPKPENVERLEELAASPDHHLELALGTNPVRVDDSTATIREGKDGPEREVPNDAVFAMIGREPPLDFFRRSGIAISGDRNPKWWITAGLMLLLMVFIYEWKKPGTWTGIGDLFKNNQWFPYRIPEWWSSLGTAFSDPQHLFGVIRQSIGAPGFYYTLIYCALMLVFGIRRIRRRRTPYVTRQTTCLWFFQFVMLFAVPYFMLPWAGNNGWFGDRVRVEALPAEVGDPLDLTAQLFPEADTSGWGAPEIDDSHWAGGQVRWPEVGNRMTINFGTGTAYLQDDTKKTWLSKFDLFPPVDYDGNGREYWRGFGLVLAWPLFIFNWFTDQPLWGWLIVGGIQTFVIIPWLVRRYGKGAYCGWICSCGGLAETMGDAHRHKMPHGPFWNKLNMIGQVFLWLAFALLLFRIVGWIFPGSYFGTWYKFGLYGSNGGTTMPWSYVWFVDLLWAGILGVAFYFHLSGRVWCRFACPLAALMHIYSRFGKFRIFAEKKKCISCNVCTSVCHQGIDIMSFANKGKPMEDPECVRCSACVQQCPTGVLSFGRLGDEEGIQFLDKLPASPVQILEAEKNE